jgi:hypothetical protein
VEKARREGQSSERVYENDKETRESFERWKRGQFTAYD